MGAAFSRAPRARLAVNIARAEELLRVLAEDRPDQLLDAWQDLPGARARGAIARRLRSLDPEVRARLGEILGVKLGA